VVEADEDGKPAARRTRRQGRQAPCGPRATAWRSDQAISNSNDGAAGSHPGKVQESGYRSWTVEQRGPAWPARAGCATARTAAWKPLRLASPAAIEEMSLSRRKGPRLEPGTSIASEPTTRSRRSRFEHGPRLSSTAPKTS